MTLALAPHQKTPYPDQPLDVNDKLLVVLTAPLELKSTLEAFNSVALFLECRAVQPIMMCTTLNWPFVQAISPRLSSDDSLLYLLYSSRTETRGRMCDANKRAG